MSMTKAEAQTHLDDALERLTAARTAQSYSIGEMSVQRASLRELREEIAYWRRVVAQFEAREQGVTAPGVAFASFR